MKKTDEKDIDVKDAQDMTLEQIIEATVKELKAKHGLKEIFVVESDGLVGYIKRPSRDQLKYAMSVSQNDPLGMTELILEGGWLAGDEALKSEDKYFLDISSQIDTIIETTSVTIKKY